MSCTIAVKSRKYPWQFLSIAYIEENSFITRKMTVLYGLRILFNLSRN